MATGTAVFFLFIVSAVIFCILYWVWIVNRRRKQLILAANMPHPSTSLPHQRVLFASDPVVRMEAGDNLDGLPKYSAQAQLDEQTVARSVPIAQTGPPQAGLRSDGMRPSVFRQASEALSRPPPAYDPSAPRPS
ncbi:hypothetical protein BDV93DRAFT_550202 [Ceratobasidium sp. AG-I]|nr:hypothetical protein BDV93DRAFT_550202 [Ceratobasidium sp. AG-I]